MSEQQPKTILFLNRVSLLGGAERVLLLSMQLARRAGDVPLLACPDGGPLPDQARALGFKVIPCAFNRMRQTRNPASLIGYAACLWREGRRVERICRELSVDLLHPHGPVSAAYAVRASRSRKLPMVVHVHDALPPTKSYRMTVRYAASTYTRFVGVSRATCEMLEQIGIERDRIHLVYNAVSSVFLDDCPQPAPEIHGPGPHIGLFALIWPLKGQHIFLRAAEVLTKRFPSARFYIVGSLAYPDYQPYLDQLREMAESPALRGCVNFTGFRDDVPRLMAAMDAVALASVEAEALPTVVMEAMALGKPVAATRLGGTEEIIEDGRTGRLVPPGDPQALADALADLLNRPEGDPLPSLARSSIRDRFSEDRYAGELAALYSEALGRKVPAAR